MYNSIYIKLIVNSDSSVSRADQGLPEDRGLERRGLKQEIKRGMRKLLRVMHRFIILSVVVILLMYKYIKFYQIVLFKYRQFICTQKLLLIK